MKKKFILIVFLIVLLHQPPVCSMSLIKECFKEVKEFLYNTNTEQKLLVGCGFLGGYLVWNEWRQHKKDKHITNLENKIAFNEAIHKEEITNLRNFANNFSWALVGKSHDKLSPCDQRSTRELFQRLKNSLGITSLTERIEQVEKEAIPNLNNKMLIMEIITIPTLVSTIVTLEEQQKTVVKEKDFKEQTSSFFIMHKNLEGIVKQMQERLNDTESVFYSFDTQNTEEKQCQIKALQTQARKVLVGDLNQRLDVLEKTLLGKDYEPEKIPPRSRLEPFLHKKRKLIKDTLGTEKVTTNHNQKEN